MCWKREKENERKERKTTQEELRRRRTRQLKQNKSTPNKNKKERAILAWERNQECFAQRRGRLEEKKLFLFLLFANGLHFNWVEVPPAKKGGRGRKKDTGNENLQLKYDLRWRAGENADDDVLGLSKTEHFGEMTQAISPKRQKWSCDSEHMHTREWQWCKWGKQRVWFVCERVVRRANREWESNTEEKELPTFRPLGYAFLLEVRRRNRVGVIGVSVWRFACLRYRLFGSLFSAANLNVSCWQT